MNLNDYIAHMMNEEDTYWNISPKDRESHQTFESLQKACEKYNRENNANLTLCRYQGRVVKVGHSVRIGCSTNISREIVEKIIHTVKYGHVMPVLNKNTEKSGYTVTFSLAPENHIKQVELEREFHKKIMKAIPQFKTPNL